jgi:hypothetical protein
MIPVTESPALGKLMPLPLVAPKNPATSFDAVIFQSPVSC